MEWLRLTAGKDGRTGKPRVLYVSLNQGELHAMTLAEAHAYLPSYSKIPTLQVSGAQYADLAGRARR